MKKLVSLMLCLLLMAGAGPAQAATASAKMNDSAFIAVYVDEERVYLDQRPIRINNRVLVPIRAISTLLDAEVEWEQATRTVTVMTAFAINTMVIDQLVAYKQVGPHPRQETVLDVPPTLYKGTTYVPLRYVSESLNADIVWKAGERAGDGEVHITPHRSLTLGGVTVTIGDTLAQVKTVLGEPDRIDESIYTFQWYVYNRDYENYMMVGIDASGKVKGFYTNAQGFMLNDGEVRYGHTHINPKRGVRLLQDKHAGNKVHGVLVAIGPSDTNKLVNNADVRLANEMQNWDATNAFRVSYFLKPLMLDESAVITARKHSQDMADQNYFDHTGLNGSSPWSRYEENNGLYFGSGENIAAGSITGIDSFNAWVNSEGHRENMLSEMHTHLGVGFGYNAKARYRYYYTQFFSRQR